MPYKLLLADDSVTIQRVIELTFADEDVQVVAVGDGQQAIARIESDRPDIVLADVGMPHRDGYEVAAFVKQHPDYQQIPVLLLTGAFEPVDEARARAAGCDGVLVKPFEPQMVINRVKDLLAGRRPAGLWTSGVSAQTPLRSPAVPGSDFDLRPAAAPETPGGSLEDYFDRLDAAFANLGNGRPDGRADSDPVEGLGLGALPGDRLPASGPASTVRPFEPPPRSPIDDLAGWDPDLAGDTERSLQAPAPAMRPAPVSAAPDARPAPVRTPPPESTPARTPPPSVPSLADAFAALLAAEQGQPYTGAPRPSALSEDVVDQIVRRVIAQMTDQAVRATVADVAERLVREEIERIKAVPSI